MRSKKIVAADKLIDFFNRTELYTFWRMSTVPLWAGVSGWWPTKSNVLEFWSPVRLSAGVSGWWPKTE